MNSEVRKKCESYPADAKEVFHQIRDMIFSTAKEQDLGEVTEQLKWGEPSYTTQSGSPIRIDWKPGNENQLSVYVNCQTVLIETFKEVYGSALKFKGNREIILPLAEPIPVLELKGCIAMALQYHKLKKLPLLGS